jgi:hypothetical protein
MYVYVYICIYCVHRITHIVCIYVGGLYICEIYVSRR